MKAKKILSVASACAMAMMVLAPGVSAEGEVVAPSESKSIPVQYDFTSTIEPAGPNYAVSIPVGIVFDAKTPGNTIGVGVEMVAAQGEDAIVAGATADVKVQSENGSYVELKEVASGTTGTDKVNYVLNYEGKVLKGKDPLEIGTLKYVGEGNASNKTSIAGTIKLKDGEVATKTGNHTDKLTYTVTDATGA